MPTQETLALGSESRTLLVDLAQRIEPRQAALAEAWNDAYLSSFGRDEHLEADQPFQGLRGLVKVFIGRLKRGDISGYLNRVEELGRLLEAQGVSYERTILSFHLLKQSLLSIVAQDYSSSAELLRVTEVLDWLDHNTLARLASSHFDAKFASLQALESVSEAALSTMDMDALLTTVLQHVTRALASSAGAILLLDKTGTNLIYRSAVGAKETSQLQDQVAIGAGFVGQVAACNAPMILHSPRPAGRRGRGHDGRASDDAFCGVPLRVGGQLIGVMYVRWEQPRVVIPREVQLLETMASRAAIAIGNARLYAESQLLTAQLTAANRELRILDQLKSDFLSVVSHELRTPLTAILGYSELILKGIHGELPERPRQHVMTIHQNGRRLLALINDLLDFSSIEAGRISLNLKATHLRPLLEKLLMKARAEASAHEIELKAVIPRGLPSVMADEQRVKQIMDHLLSNAIKFTPCGGHIDVRVDHGSPEPDNRADGRDGFPEMLTISVGDTGIGIPPEELEKIWDRFYQVEDAATRRFGGTGLGLAVVKTLVEMHGGRVWAQSKGTPGSGSTFSFTLVVAKLEDQH